MQKQLEAGGDYGLNDDQLAEQSAFVRALLVQRLEQIWTICQPHVSGEVKPDPRFVEAGIRVLDRLAKLFRLDHPVAGHQDLRDQDPEVLRVAARAQLAELEARQGWE